MTSTWRPLFIRGQIELLKIIQSLFEGHVYCWRHVWSTSSPCLVFFLLFVGLVYALKKTYLFIKNHYEQPFCHTPQQRDRLLKLLQRFIRSHYCNCKWLWNITHWQYPEDIHLIEPYWLIEFSSALSLLTFMTNDSRGVHVGHLAHCFWIFSSSIQRDYYLSFQLSVLK